MNSICSTCTKRLGNNCTAVSSGSSSVNHLNSCPIGLWPGKGQTIAPFRKGEGKRWEGVAPWRDRQVSVILPIIEYNATLDLVLECLRRQTVQPVIYIIDTGSHLTTDKILALRDESTEVIQLRLQGWYHPSWPVAAALDAAWGCINTPYCFFTHDDCFIKQQDTLEQLLPLASEHFAVGHQITERDYSMWQHDFGHTFLMLKVKEMDQIPLVWNMRAYEAMTGVSCDPSKCKSGFPDTETMMNHLFRLRRGWVPSFEPQSGVPLFLGTEENFQRNENDWFDHCRSMTCGFLYSKDYHTKAIGWTRDAMVQCRKRLETWT